MDLARGFAALLGVELELVVFDTAGKSVDAVTEERADIGFFAIDPKRGEGIRFTAPYVLIEGCYAVRESSPLSANEEVDRPGTTVVVGQGSAYDLFLTRELKQATILRAPSSPAVVEHFLAQAADVAAGVRQQLEADALRLGGLRLLPGPVHGDPAGHGLPAQPRRPQRHRCLRATWKRPNRAERCMPHFSATASPGRRSLPPRRPRPGSRPLCSAAMTEQQQLEAAIAALEGQRSTLGDAVVESTPVGREGQARRR